MRLYLDRSDEFLGENCIYNMYIFFIFLFFIFYFLIPDRLYFATLRNKPRNSASVTYFSTDDDETFEYAK